MPKMPKVMCAVLVAFTMVLSGCTRHPGGLEATIVHNDLLDLSYRILVFSDRSPEFLNPNLLNDGSVLFSNLVATRRSSLHLEDPRWYAEKRVADPWGNDYCWEIVTRTNEDGQVRHQLRGWSRGPRGWRSPSKSDLDKLSFTLPLDFLPD